MSAKSFKKGVSLFFNAVLLTGSLALALIAAEAALRFTPYKSLISGFRFPEGYVKEDSALKFDFSANFKPTVVATPDCAFTVWTNELGCFDKPYRGEKDYILLTGDSFTWGFAEFKDKYGTLIEDYLNYRVVKCGVGAYGTKQELLKIKKTVKKMGISPRLVIVGYFLLNDFEDDIRFSAWQKGSVLRNNGNRIENTQKPSLTPRQCVKLWLVKHSILYNMIRQNDIVMSIAQKFGLLDKPAHSSLCILQIDDMQHLKEAFREHLGNLRDIKKLCDETGSKLLIVLIPSREQVYEFLNPHHYDFDKFNSRLRGFFRKEEMDYLDLTPAFRKLANQEPRERLDPKSDFYWRYDPHWTPKGDKLAALLITKYIIERDLIEISDKEAKEQKVNREFNKIRNYE